MGILVAAAYILTGGSKCLFSKRYYAAEKYVLRGYNVSSSAGCMIELYTKTMAAFIIIIIITDHYIVHK